MAKRSCDATTRQSWAATPAHDEHFPPAYQEHDGGSKVESDIVMYTAGYVAARLALMAGFGYVLYHVLRPARSTVRSIAGRYRRDARRPNRSDL